jgi:hypothetical protein
MEDAKKGTGGKWRRGAEGSAFSSSSSAHLWWGIIIGMGRWAICVQAGYTYADRTVAKVL